MEGNYIRFDWAMKRLLRNKANFVVLEGFLASLIGKKFKIERFLESEGNQSDEEDKYNRVDILAKARRENSALLKYRIVVNCHISTVCYMAFPRLSQNISV